MRKALHTGSKADETAAWIFCRSEYKQREIHAYTCMYINIDWKIYHSCIHLLQVCICVERYTCIHMYVHQFLLESLSRMYLSWIISSTERHTCIHMYVHKYPVEILSCMYLSSAGLHMCRETCMHKYICMSVLTRLSCMNLCVCTFIYQWIHVCL